MITCENIDTTWAEVKERQEAYDELYKMFLKQKLVELGIDGEVIRKTDGKKGKILVVPATRASREPYEYEFHPITKSGKVSKNRDGFIIYTLYSIEYTLTRLFLKGE